MRKIIFRAKGEGGDGEKKDNKREKDIKEIRIERGEGEREGGAVGWDGVRCGRAGRRAAGLSRKRRGGAGRGGAGRGAPPPD